MEALGLNAGGFVFLYQIGAIQLTALTLARFIPRRQNNCTFFNGSSSDLRRIFCYFSMLDALFSQESVPPV
ncbi:hypothetical protein, partial [Ferrovum myxofaciens]|uniref:hypothetical protein n=1 Tax=Ferrovum myxofaciens TaxID=416213 RepID=UPI001D0D6A98